MGLIRQREITKREQLALEKQLFEQRTSLRQMKQTLPEQYKDGDEDLLINQKVTVYNFDLVSSSLTKVAKPQKKKPLEITTQRASATQLKLLSRQDSRSAEADMELFSDRIAEQENHIQQKINMRISQHQKWNEGYIDMTKAPLTPPLEENMKSSFRTAMMEYLPTPPASVSSEQSGEATIDTGSPLHGKDDAIAVRYASGFHTKHCQSQPSFRRRFGRGGRLMIDRRGMRVQSKEGLDEVIVERFKFDHEDEDEVPIYVMDPYDVSSMRYRAKISGSQQSQSQTQGPKRHQIDAPSTNTQGIATASDTQSLLSQPKPD